LKTKAVINTNVAKNSGIKQKNRISSLKSNIKNRQIPDFKPLKIKKIESVIFKKNAEIEN